MEIPSPIILLGLGEGETLTLVLPQVQSISTGYDYIDSRRVPLVTVRTVGDPVTVQADSPEAAEAIAQDLRSQVTLWHLYISMGPVLYNQIMVSEPSQDEG
jgi:hypothetical protein